MRDQPFALVYAAMLVFGTTCIATAQENATNPPSAQQQLQAIPDPRSMGPRSIDEELAHLTKDLELTPEQQKQVRPLLQEHHDKIQALLDKNPSATRQQLAPQIHAISDETHREIHALLSEHQQQLEEQMIHRMNHGEEHRRPTPP